MDARTYRINNTAQTLLQDFPQGSSSDTVVISIYDVDDGAYDYQNVAMTSVKGTTWKYSWTPTQGHVFEIDYWNQTLDVHYFEYAYVVGQVPVPVSGSVGGSTLVTLRKEFLIQIDQYNANDLSGDSSSGDQANKAINKALQKCYQLIRDSRFMQAYPTTSLVSTSGQDYIDLGAVTDLDEIISLQDTTNIVKLVKIPWHKYRTMAPDPSQMTGVPYYYSRLFNRIYLLPRPSSAITYTAEYIKIYSELSADADQALIPSMYNYWIYSEAEVEWYKMQDANNIPQIVLTERAENREIALKSIMSAFNENYQSESNFGRNIRRTRVDQLDI